MENNIEHPAASNNGLATHLRQVKTLCCHPLVWSTVHNDQYLEVCFVKEIAGESQIGVILDGLLPGIVSTVADKGDDTKNAEEITSKLRLGLDYYYGHESTKPVTVLTRAGCTKVLQPCVPQSAWESFQYTFDEKKEPRKVEYTEVWWRERVGYPAKRLSPEWFILGPGRDSRGYLRGKPLSPIADEKMDHGTAPSSAAVSSSSSSVYPAPNRKLAPMQEDREIPSASVVIPVSTVGSTAAHHTPVLSTPQSAVVVPQPVLVAPQPTFAVPRPRPAPRVPRPVLAVPLLLPAVVTTVLSTTVLSTTDVITPFGMTVVPASDFEMNTENEQSLQTALLPMPSLIPSQMAL
jgi:hypothetical protein